MTCEILDTVSMKCFMLKMLEHPDLNNLNSYLMFVTQIANMHDY